MKKENTDKYDAQTNEASLFMETRQTNKIYVSRNTQTTITCEISKFNDKQDEYIVLHNSTTPLNDAEKVSW